MIILLTLRTISLGNIWILLGDLLRVKLKAGLRQPCSQGLRGCLIRQRDYCGDEAESTTTGGILHETIVFCLWGIAVHCFAIINKTDFKSYKSGYLIYTTHTLWINKSEYRKEYLLYIRYAVILAWFCPCFRGWFWPTLYFLCETSTWHLDSCPPKTRGMAWLCGCWEF